MPSRRGIVAVLTSAALIALWAWATGPGRIISPVRFPSPPLVWEALVQVSTVGFGGATLPVHIVTSVALVIEGFLVAAGTGTALGLAMGWDRRVAAIVNPIFQLIRPIPPLSWIPLVILWLGFDNSAKILVIWFAAFVPALINTQSGVRDIPEHMIEAAYMLGTPRWRLLWGIVVPAALPTIFTGLRLSLQASWTTLVAAELVGSFYGLGHILNEAQQSVYPGMIFVGMAAVGLFGWLTTVALAFIESRVLAWHPSVRELVSA